MAEESKIADPDLNKDIVASAISPTAEDEEASDEHDEEDAENPAAAASDKKKKSKRQKLKAAVTGKDASGDPSSSSNGVTAGMVDQILSMNPSLKGEVAGLDKEHAAEKLKKLDLSDLLTGMVCYDKARPCQATTSIKKVMLTKR